MSLILAAAGLLTCTVTDGDTLRCGPDPRARTERVRLIGIDAPELPGHCQNGRACAKGNPRTSTANLRRLVEGRPVRIERVGLDRYGRTLALAWVGPVNLSCAQVRAGAAIYVERWDQAGRVRRCLR